YYEERSPVYNEVANYGLLYLAEYWGRTDFYELIARNLHFTIAMRQPDGEAEPVFSHRRDRGRADWRWGDYLIFRRLAGEWGGGSCRGVGPRVLGAGAGRVGSLGTGCAGPGDGECGPRGFGGAGLGQVRRECRSPRGRGGGRLRGAGGVGVRRGARAWAGPGD